MVFDAAGRGTWHRGLTQADHGAPAALKAFIKR
jgi:hypothetical protein